MCWSLRVLHTCPDRDLYRDIMDADVPKMCLCLSSGHPRITNAGEWSLTCCAEQSMASHALHSLFLAPVHGAEDQT